MSEMMKNALNMLAEGLGLSADDAALAMDDIMAGKATPAQIGAFLMALRLKGESWEEIAGCAMSLKAHSLRVTPARRGLIDTCGTGGDSLGTFNVSTTSAFVVAGCGVPVAKHGNRSISSRSGSADVLAALGVAVELTPADVADSIDKVGIGFLYAPNYHPAMRHAMGPRRELGIRTIFNLLGPLANPAMADTQVVGVFSTALTNTMAQALRATGCRRAMVVSGFDGMDEITLTAKSAVSELRDGMIIDYEIDPRELGLSLCSLAELSGGEAGENAATTRAILSGVETGPKRALVLVNAAAALYVSGRVRSLSDGILMAAQSIDAGEAYKKLDALIAFSHECAVRTTRAEVESVVNDDSMGAEAV